MATTPNLSSSAANAASSKNRIPGVCDCTDPVDKSALILYPSLGTPLLLKEGQKTCSIFIVGEASLRPCSGAGNVTPSEAPNLHVFVDRHLRLYPISEKEAQTDTTTGTLFGDGKTCEQASAHIKAWRVGQFNAGALIKDRHGRPFATIAPMSVQVYADFQGSDIYEVQLDLDAAPFKAINSSGFLSFAWMVRLNDEGKKLVPGATHAEPQDLLIASFLNQQCDSDPYHFKNVHEFNLGGNASTAVRLPPQANSAGALLRSWHPVKYMPARPLKLGHLSDVHVNVRHTALSKSAARILEGGVPGIDQGWNQCVGTKVCNSFDALSALLAKMASGPDKADAVLVTGDLIDFNRNIDPRESGGTIAEQWKAFNLLANVPDEDKGPRLYPRGLDDMLVYSLIRKMYREHKLPVFLTSGNHEAYQVPYGISARVEKGSWGYQLGELEVKSDPGNLAAIAGAAASTTAEIVAGAVGDFKSVLNPGEAMDSGKSPRGGKPEGFVSRLTGGRKALGEHLKKFEEASAWVRGKANEGMSRDHNMTIYETCLAYGPTYGQVLTGFNFSSAKFDWFYALFTPLADCVVAYGAPSDDASGRGALQTIAALGWGTQENYLNLFDAIDGKDGGADRQGTGILPRAVESFSHEQMALLKQAASYKSASQSTLTVATHFTIVSFDEPEPYSNVAKAVDRCSFVPHDGPTGIGFKGAFNQVNVGTCERHQAVYLEQYVNAPGARGSGARVDWHLSGHSHRSGVYRVRWQQDNARAIATRRMQVHSAKDPGIHGPQSVPPDSGTALIVSSCGGPIGYQNLDGELSAWTGRPPSGTLLDCATGNIRQVSTSRSRLDRDRVPFNEKPRLCVALDYLWVMSALPDKGNIDVPLSFDVPRFSLASASIKLRLSTQMKKLNCIASMTLWLFEGGKDSFGQPRPPRWHRITTELDRVGTPTQAKFARGSDAVLEAAFATGKSGKQTNSAFKRIQAAFCEIGLQKPAATDAGEDWAKDMVWNDDPWVFPLDVVSADGGRTVAHLERPGGERGEVPDWEFLARSFADRGYVPPLNAIKPKQ